MTEGKRIDWFWLEEKPIIHENPETDKAEEWIEGTMTANFIAKYSITEEAQKLGLAEDMRKRSQERCKESIARLMVEAVLPQLREDGKLMPDMSKAYILPNAEGRTLIVSREEYAKLWDEWHERLKEVEE